MASDYSEHSIARVATTASGGHNTMRMRPRASTRNPATAADIRSAMDALRRMVRGLRLTARAAEKQLGVSGAQAYVLQQLAEHGAQSVGQLAVRTFTHYSSVSVVVSRLASRGLVERAASAQDARRVEVTLTAAGRALVRKAPTTAQTKLINSLRRLGARSVKILAAELTRLVTEMGMQDIPPYMLFEEEPKQREGKQVSVATAPRARRRAETRKPSGDKPRTALV